MAGRIATLLTGKHRPTYADEPEDGDGVVIINAKHVSFSGKKWKQKIYRRHTGFPGGLQEVPAFEMRERKPEEILRRAINSMLPKNRLRSLRMSRLKIFADTEHPYSNLFNPSTLPAAAPDFELPDAVKQRIAESIPETYDWSKVVTVPPLKKEEIPPAVLPKSAYKGVGETING